MIVIVRAKNRPPESQEKNITKIGPSQRFSRKNKIKIGQLELQKESADAGEPSPRPPPPRGRCHRRAALGPQRGCARSAKAVMSRGLQGEPPQPTKSIAQRESRGGNCRVSPRPPGRTWYAGRMAMACRVRHAAHEPQGERPRAAVTIAPRKSRGWNGRDLQGPLR